MQIADEFLIDSLAGIVRKMRQTELAVLRCENALMRWHCVSHCVTPSGLSDSPIEIQTPRTVREGLRRVINGEPMDCYQVYNKIQTQFPQLPINLESCQVGLRVLKRTGDIIEAGTKPAPRGGHPCTLYTKPVERSLQGT